MNIEARTFDHTHPLGELATHPIARLAALYPQGVDRIRRVQPIRHHIAPTQYAQLSPFVTRLHQISE